MKIAILAPSPIPFTIGGAEKLWEGLYTSINKFSSHQCELIKVPIKEDTFWNLIESYEIFYNLNLDHFDMVISGKYPAWMLKHKNHHLYMLHTLRGVYDLYNYKTIQTKPLIPFLDKNLSIEEIFSKLSQIKQLHPGIPFSHPFAKDTITLLDQKAMQNIKNFYAISKTVASRFSYFPPNTNPKIVYPPTSLKNLHSKSYSYFLVVSRLDKPKRIDIIIKAYIASKTNIPLKIAGTGKEYDYLKKIAKNSKNISFLGYVSDEELVKLYANAYGVIFIPYQEDYGLVTIEAMLSKKPIITFSDSGGVLEFAKHNKTALVSNPTIKDLSKNIKLLSDNPNLAKKLGENAYTKVKHISWKNTVNTLLQKRKKLLLLSTYPIYPPRGGGQNRIYYLYKELAKEYDIIVISLVDKNLQPQKEIAPNFIEIQVSKSKEFLKKEKELENIFNIPVTDISFMLYHDLLTTYKQTLLSYIQKTDYCFLEHPYTYPMIKELFPSFKLIYSSHNVEYLLKKDMLKQNDTSKDILQTLFFVEQECYQKSNIVTSCSKEDAKNFINLYEKREIHIVPNGIDNTQTIYTSTKSKKMIKKLYNFNPEEKYAIFIGSNHYPNVKAVRDIIDLSKKSKDIKYIIIGGVNESFKDAKYPQNITFTGLIDDKEKSKYLQIADIALNPISIGSGTNLKIVEYLSCGIPTISTTVGIRGLNPPPATVIVDDDIKNWQKYFNIINHLVNPLYGRIYIEKHFSWQNIAKKLKEVLK